MKIIAVLSVMLFVTTISGCATRNIYEGLRMQQEMECQSRPGANPEECFRRSGMSYDEYQRQLDERQKNK
jgi:hypothetical protein